MAQNVLYCFQQKNNCFSRKDNLEMQQEYFLIDKNVLPDVFSKVVETKKLLQTGECKTVNDATKKIGISRSVFYKYRDSVHVFVEKDKQNIITIILYLTDEVGATVSSKEVMP